MVEKVKFEAELDRDLLTQIIKIIEEEYGLDPFVNVLAERGLVDPADIVRELPTYRIVSIKG